MDQSHVSLEMDQYLQRLFPLMRSISGTDNLKTLEILSEIVPIDIQKVPSGSRIFDWTVPPEWHVKHAYVEDAAGTKHLDLQETNLHIVNFSVPIDAVLTLEELRDHLHLHPTIAAAIPYRTTYYNRTWGFCLSVDELEALEAAPGPFHIVIEAEFKDGNLVYGECLIPGNSSREFLISTYICHPSMANDNLSGMILTAFLARELVQRSATSNWTYRVAFVPETIGALAYCSINEDQMRKIDMGFVIATTGGPGPLSMKQSWNASHELSQIAESVIKQLDPESQIVPFDVRGSDERQYSSPAFRINTVTIGRDLYYRYPEYHSSLDNLDFVNGTNMVRTLDAYTEVISRIEDLRFFQRTDGRGEPMLSRHNLYSELGGGQLPKSGDTTLDVILWVLFLSDGKTSLRSISDKTGFDYRLLERTSEGLSALELLKEV